MELFRALLLATFLMLSANAFGQELQRANEEVDLWWQQMFSMSFDGHGYFVSPHLDTLHTTAASLSAGGYHGVWDADLNRDMPWMRGHEQSFANHPETKRIVYIEGNRSEKVLARLSADGRVLFTSRLLEDAKQDPTSIPYDGISTRNFECTAYYLRKSTLSSL